MHDNHSCEGGHGMIARLWKGWTQREDADAYERLLRDKVLPGLRTIDGYLGGYVLRHDGDGEVEFAVMNLFESLDAVRAFAGPEYTVPVFEHEARQLLSKVEPIARHYNVVSINSGTSPSSLSRLGNRPSM